MTRVLIAQHESDADSGRLGSALQRAGVVVDEVLTHEGRRLPPTLAGYDGFVSLGGAMYVSDGDRYPFIAHEQELFREAIGSAVPALGICLGGQILASALGARIRPAQLVQIGWDLVQVEDAADPLMAAIAPAARLFEWHSDSFELPGGATLLARSDEVPVQAFRAGSAWAMQFHIEVERRHLEAWSSGPGGAAELASVGRSADQLLRECSVPLARQQRLADRMFDAFARICSGTVDAPAPPAFEVQS
jgi:GMP synthase-like glutamine amidotransferase